MSSYSRSSEQGGATEPPPVRYDEPMQQRIIALASQLQHQHQGTVTAAELEAIGIEVGLAPSFVRQAIAQIGGSPAPAASGPARETRPGSRFWDSRVTAWTRRDANVLGGTLALTAIISGTELANGVLLVAFALGVLLGPKRRVAWAGAATIATAIFVRMLTYHNSLFSFLDCVDILGFSAFGAALTAAGAALRGVIDTLRGKSPAPVGISAKSVLR